MGKELNYFFFLKKEKRKVPQIPCIMISLCSLEIKSSNYITRFFKHHLKYIKNEQYCFWSHNSWS